MSSPRRGALAGVLAAFLVAVVAACGSDPTGVQFEVIEEVQFGDTLGINLAAMTKIDSLGIYYQDLVVGTGDSAATGDTVFVQYVGALRDGTQFDAGSFSFRFFNPNDAIAGLQLGMQGQQIGGTRLMIIPPGWAYGSQAVGPIYAGAIVIFRIQLDSIHPVQ